MCQKTNNLQAVKICLVGCKWEQDKFGKKSKYLVQTFTTDVCHYNIDDNIINTMSKIQSHSLE